MPNGRLKRETNAVPGEMPGFLPQHEGIVSGDFKVTGERNPLPVTDATVENALTQMRNELSTIKSEMQQIRQKQATTPTSLVGYSSETKPTQGIVKASSFFELNTGNVFMYDGNGWVMI